MSLSTSTVNALHSTTSLYALSSTTPTRSSSAPFAALLAIFANASSTSRVIRLYLSVCINVASSSTLSARSNLVLASSSSSSTLVVVCAPLASIIPRSSLSSSLKSSKSARNESANVVAMASTNAAPRPKASSSRPKPWLDIGLGARRRTTTEVRTGKRHETRGRRRAETTERGGKISQPRDARQGTTRERWSGAILCKDTARGDEERGCAGGDGEAGTRDASVDRETRRVAGETAKRRAYLCARACG
mmetsp:Transcript_7981/g.26705  ORF Transcript_7981/g.26705 Transcript_7981/m.26705 type:complete len:248 (-) Transcript_7981:297-1040(-)